jgi:hypothetical protein
MDEDLQTRLDRALEELVDLRRNTEILTRVTAQLARATADLQACQTCPVNLLRQLWRKR